ncbi:MAG: hypothetical protein RLZZ200_1263 [Pseudomonadota bacterium]
MKTLLWMWGVLSCATCGAVAASAPGEQLPGMRINGLSVEVTRLSGRNLAGTVRRIEAQWRASGGDTSVWRQEGAWRLLSHRDGRWSDVMQLRATDGEPEALLSRLDLTQRPAPVPALPMPPGCRATSTVETHDPRARVVQASGPCRASVAADTARWYRQLAGQGWTRTDRIEGQVSQWRRGSAEIEFVRGTHWFTALKSQTGEPAP